MEFYSLTDIFVPCWWAAGLAGFNAPGMVLDVNIDFLAGDLNVEGSS